MIVRDSTHSMTSLTFQNYFPGDSLPLFSTAAGKVHFAYCDAVEREAIVEGLRTFGATDERAAAYFSDTIQQARRVRRRGYATHGRNQATETPGKTSSLSVPLFHGERFIATLNLIFFTSAMSMDAAVERYLKPLQATAERISGQLERDPAIASAEQASTAALGDGAGAADDPRSAAV